MVLLYCFYGGVTAVQSKKHFSICEVVLDNFDEGYRCVDCCEFVDESVVPNCVKCLFHVE